MTISRLNLFIWGIISIFALDIILGLSGTLEALGTLGDG
jgi:hypothetical protein